MSKKKHQFTGYTGDCSEEQLASLAEFRKYVTTQGFTNPPYDDSYLLRFCRARKFDVPKVIIMWDNYQKFRIDLKVDTLRNYKYDEVKEMKKFYPQGYFRTDKLGRPIFIERTGMIRFNELFEATTLERYTNWFVYTYEHLLHVKFPACSKKMGKKVEQTVYIMDLKGGAMKLLTGKTYAFIKHCTSIGQDNYPEVLGKMFIINTPMFFYAVWNIIKIWIDEKTRNKVNILGSSYKKELMEYIDENDIPDFLGGKAGVEEYGENMTNDDGPWIQYEKEMKDAVDAKKLAAQKKQQDQDIMIQQEEEKKVEQKRMAKVSSSNNNKSFDLMNPDLIFDTQYDGDLEIWEVPVVHNEPVFLSKVKHLETQILPALMTLRTTMTMGNEDVKVKA